MTVVTARFMPARRRSARDESTAPAGRFSHRCSRSSRRPAGITARGELRDQYTHCSDVVPTVYECLGIEPPATVKGYTQRELEGTSFRSSFDHAAAPTRKTTQYYAMLVTRASGTRAGRPTPFTPRRPATGATTPRSAGSLPLGPTTVLRQAGLSHP